MPNIRGGVVALRDCASKDCTERARGRSGCRARCRTIGTIPWRRRRHGGTSTFTAWRCHVRPQLCSFSLPSLNDAQYLKRSLTIHHQHTKKDIRHWSILYHLNLLNFEKIIKWNPRSKAFTVAKKWNYVYWLPINIELWKKSWMVKNRNNNK